MEDIRFAEEEKNRLTCIFTQNIAHEESSKRKKRPPTLNSGPIELLLHKLDLWPTGEVSTWSSLSTTLKNKITKVLSKFYSFKKIIFQFYHQFYQKN